MAHGAEIELRRRGRYASNPDVQVMIEAENVTEHLRAPGCGGVGVDGRGGRGGPDMSWSSCNSAPRSEALLWSWGETSAPLCCPTRR